jgi:hypothetical protein
MIDVNLQRLQRSHRRPSVEHACGQFADAVFECLRVAVKDIDAQNMAVDVQQAPTEDKARLGACAG